MPGLDETNNESYKYLRSVGNTWQYNVEDLHPKMLSRLYKRFDTFDLDSDERMEMDEVLYWPDRMRQLVNATDEQVEKMRHACKTFFWHKGVDLEHGLHRDDWVEANRVFAEAERERGRRGEPSLIALLSNSYYDVLDDDGDGTVDVDELKTMMKAFDVPQEAAYTFFEKADTDKSGKLERNELVHLFRKFWMEPYDPQWDGVYAFKY
ncbi:obelin-like [Bolinopsis microptera]|uniref:obelin-like n=1 Tax=Bolinopsis microptera TaxID=2820187 RepID=UPI003079034F